MVFRLQVLFLRVRWAGSQLMLDGDRVTAVWLIWRFPQSWGYPKWLGCNGNHRWKLMIFWGTPIYRKAPFVDLFATSPMWEQKMMGDSCSEGIVHRYGASEVPDERAGTSAFATGLKGSHRLFHVNFEDFKNGRITSKQISDIFVQQIHFVLFWVVFHHQLWGFLQDKSH